MVLGSQGVGKTSLVHRYVKNAFAPPTTVSTVGASFVTKRVVDADTSTVVRLQIWDTAGQERFRSISKLYYRGANAGVLCYDVTDARSFDEMGRWLRELKQSLGEDMIIHVVGTKSDIVAEDPSQRQVPFERCISYVADNLYSDNLQQTLSAPTTLASGSGWTSGAPAGTAVATSVGAAAKDHALTSPQSNRSSGFWGGDVGWDCCHEISAKDGEGVEEVFRVITRKLVEQRNKQLEAEQRELMRNMPWTPGSAMSGGGLRSSYSQGGANGYFDQYGSDRPNGSFRLGYGDKRRSWLGFPTTPGSAAVGQEWQAGVDELAKKRGGKCC